MKTFEEAARDAARRIDGTHYWIPSDATRLVENLKESHGDSNWKLMARDVLDYMNPDDGAHMWVPTLCKKQHDYGPQNILKYGEMGLQVRTWDKIARIENLIMRDDDAENEPLTDSLWDIIGYCMIAIMLRRGTFELPLAADLKETA